LLASAIAASCQLYTADNRLAEIARQLRIGYSSH
jgi:predicted nucleic acid-binding protein